MGGAVFSSVSVRVQRGNDKAFEPVADQETAAGDILELSEKLAWGQEPTADGRFLTVHMDQNSRCNLRCLACGFSDPRVDALSPYDMPRELFDSIARQVFPLTSYLLFSIQTEPFMTRDFPERLFSAREHGVPFSEAITNGTLLTDSVIDSVIDSGITRLTISIDGGTKEVAERNRPGSRFENVVASARQFQQRRRWRGLAVPMLRINHLLSELNIDSFHQFLALVESLEPEFVEVRVVERMSNAVVQEATDPEFWTKVRAARVVLDRFCERTGIQRGGYLRPTLDRIEVHDATGRRMTCRAPWTKLAILPNGDALPCISWTREPLGNFHLHTFEEIWNGPAAVAVRREFEERSPGVDCVHCAVKKDVPPREHDDFFYRKLARNPPRTVNDGK